MSDDATSILEDARSDLAFMRALATPGWDGQVTFGRIYFVTGLCYGVQMLLHVAQQFGLAPTDSLYGSVIGFGPTVVFLAALSVILTRPGAKMAPTAVNRAVAAAFGSVGLANLLLIVILGSVAWRLHTFTVWLVYPCVVLVLQGSAWRIVYEVRRRAWMAVVSVGWFATGLAMGLSIFNIVAYLSIGAAGLFAFMVAPGFVMMRRRAGA